MKITKRQLKRIISEASSGYADERRRNPMERAYARYVEDFEAWIQETGQLPAAIQGQDQDRAAILATYLVDQGLDKNIELIGVLTSEYKMDKTIVDQQLTTARAEYEAGGLESEEDNYERGFFRESKMKITKRQLKRIIKEAIDVTNASTGEVMVFADEGDPAAEGFKPDAPELAARNVIKRLGLTPLTDIDVGDREPGVEEIYLGAEDWAVMDVEIGGKRHARKNKKERARMNIDNLLVKVNQWAGDASGDYGADNPDIDMQDVAWDLAAGAEYIFKPDEWDELIWHFDNSEDELVTYIADRIAG